MEQVRPVPSVYMEGDMGELISTKELFGLKVVGGKRQKRVGKVRRFVFHPSERRCIGFLVKRPDAALMFHRKDLFVALDGFHIEDDQVVVHDDSEATERGAIKALGVNWEKCVIWVGMPVVTESGEALGFVDVVAFDRETGEVAWLTTENGAANKAILGKRKVPGKFVRGFRRGPADDPENPGVILAADEVLELAAEGGAAAAAGKATAVVTSKAKQGAAAAKPVAQKAAKATGEAVDAGSYALGKQLGKATGMFAAFKDEYKKAAQGDDE